jgi:hypothetical protein
MTTFVQFRGYGINAADVAVDVARVTHFYSFDYNGRPGTMLVLDTGAEVRVDGYSFDVAKKIRAEIAAKQEAP